MTVNHEFNQLSQQKNNQFEPKGKETGRNEERLSDLLDFIGWAYKTTQLHTCTIPQDKVMPGFLFMRLKNELSE